MNAATLSLVFVILFGVTVLFCEGWIGGATEHCLCQGTNLQKRVKPARVQTVNVFAPSASCSYIELIVTLKTGRKLCLDPTGNQGKRILREQRRQKKVKTQRGKKQTNKNKQQN